MIVMTHKAYATCLRRALRVAAFALLFVQMLHAPAITYTRQDSIKVTTLLSEGLKQPKTTPLTLFYANKFIGLPYVAHTLEVNDTEQLVVNLRQLDCTTLIDNIVALTLTTQQGSTRFEDFCYWLQRLRYRDGKLTDYASRNHYYSQAIASDERLGILHEIGSDASTSQSAQQSKSQKGQATGREFPFTATQVIDLHYMSQHPEQYRMLKDAPKTLKDRIRKHEQEFTGKIIRYIPTALLDKGREQLSCIHDGDILALVTSKDGLDVSHLGIAVWGKDGKLHLLNASSIHKKVVLETMTLADYMRKQSHRLGIRVLRVNESTPHAKEKVRI